MTKLLTILFILVSQMAFADIDNAEWGYCGVVRKKSSLQLETRTQVYLLEPSEDISLQDLLAIPNGERRCFLGEPSSRTDGKKVLTVYDFDEYQSRKTLLDCRAEYVDESNSPFEEGFSVEEYPEVRVVEVLDSDNEQEIGLHVSIGALSDFESASGDVIRFSSRNKSSVTVSVKAIHLEGTLKIVVNKKPKARSKRRAGEVIYDNQVIARITCAK